MADNEKLLEAARMIQKHCEHTEQGGLCPFARGGVCDGFNLCGIAPKEFIPGEDWDIPKQCRWTDADVNMAKALQTVGFVSVMKAPYSCSILAKRDRGARWEVPSGLFESIKSGESVQLSDIVAEGESK